MDCRDVQRAIAEGWETGEAPPWRAARHLRACGACAEAVPSIERALRAARSAGAPDPGDLYWEGFLPRLKRRIAERPAGDPSRGAEGGFAGRRARLLVPAAAAAAVALAAGLAWLARPPAGGAREEADLAGLEVQLDSDLREAGGRARERIAEVLPPDASLDLEREAAPVSDGAGDPADLEEALRTLDETSPPLAPARLGGWPDLEGLIGDLTESEAEAFIHVLREPGRIEAAGAPDEETC